MKICLVAEGCYPYVVGGVSSWIHSMIQAFPNIEFSILAIVANRSQRGKFVYELPQNVTQVYEAYLDDLDWENKKRKKRKKIFKLDERQHNALRSIILNEEVDWDTLFEMFQSEKMSIDDLLMGPDFLEVVRESYNRRFSQMIFSDFLWTVRSIYLPLFLILKTPIPMADIYHCVATGYAGVLGSMAQKLYGCGLLISEHGIYTREREEELLKASWVASVYKNIWIDQFRKMSKLAYERADIVTCLFSHAKQLQIGLGCKEDKIAITPNGIDAGRFVNLPGKLSSDNYINIGAVLRVTPIKDVKTMLRAFGFAKQKVENLRLWIMGPCDEDPEYAKECYDLVEKQEISGVFFTGKIDIRDYLGRMDFTILTSISEGQPLTILESYAAHKPVIATDVGNCRELIYGDGDGCGTAGILTHIMNVGEIADAIVEMATSPELRKKMGNCGYRRLMKRYQLHQMQERYEALYKKLCMRGDCVWPIHDFYINQQEEWDEKWQELV